MFDLTMLINIINVMAFPMLEFNCVLDELFRSKN